MQVAWYWSRLRRMSPSEVAWRVRDEALKAAGRRRQVLPGAAKRPPPTVDRLRACPLRIPAEVADRVPVEARTLLLEEAGRLLDGQWTVLGVTRTDLEVPDWFLDPVTGRRAPDAQYSFAINHRSEERVGNIKQVWELSRHHHITVLAAAWFLTQDERYAQRAAEHLRSWWELNPFLSGVHWISGIELGVRLISWTWTRRLLDGWPGVAELFEGNDQAARQLHWHQQYLATYRSTGSSANNHVIAEAAGQLVASCGLPWFPESATWRDQATLLLERELVNNTFPCGVNRELATAYHGFVAELGLLAHVEAQAAGKPFLDRTTRLLSRMLDSAAALVDVRLRPPRQGDGDGGRTLVVDGDDDSWRSLLAMGGALAGSLPWWPDARADVRSSLVGAVAGCPLPAADRPTQRPDHFPDAGITLLRTRRSTSEIWCRCDGGPHGYLSIAAHGHADALSVEVRHGGVDILADPGTYCYHGEAEWRQFFRSTFGHNTLEVGGRDQSRSGGPFLWEDRARTRLVGVSPDSWTAEHDGYQSLTPALTHQREVRLDRDDSRLTITDRLLGDGHHPCRLTFHLGPTVDVSLNGHEAALSWGGPEGMRRATIALPIELRWTTEMGSTNPIVGWYSPQFGVRVPATTLVGAGICDGGSELRSVVAFARGAPGSE